MEGVVIKSTGSWYDVRLADGQVLKARIKGKFRLSDIKHTNPVSVGDKVELESEPSQETAVIKHIEDRKNYIIRKASNLSKQTHIIASNMDQLLVIVTLVSPPTSMGFIDRILITAEAYHIPVVLVFNKTDIYDETQQHRLKKYISLYEIIGYTCLSTSAYTSTGLDALKQTMKGKVSLVMGHSGVGKSTLLNSIDSQLHIKTGKVSDYHQKGQHTTTFAEMFSLSFGGDIIDTPGIREFGIVDIPDAELSHYFKEMRPYIGSCKFNNCIHVNEPGCAVVKAIQSGAISEERYKSYLSILYKEDLYA